MDPCKSNIGMSGPCDPCGVDAYIAILAAAHPCMSPEAVKWSMKSSSWINNLCLLTGPIDVQSVSRVLLAQVPDSQRSSDTTNTRSDMGVRSGSCQQ